MSETLSDDVINSGYSAFIIHLIYYIILLHTAKSTDLGCSRILVKVKSYIFTHDRHDLLDILNQLARSQFTILNFEYISAKY